MPFISLKFWHNAGNIEDVMKLTTTTPLLIWYFSYRELNNEDKIDSSDV